MSTEPTIPTLDINDFTTPKSPEQKKEFVRKLGATFENTGFVIIKNHPINADIQKSVYDRIKTFFDMPVETKKKFELPGTGGARGYTTFGKEHAKDSKHGDLKEFFHVGMELPQGHAYRGTKDYPDNVSVPSIPGFDQTLRGLYSDLLALGTSVLQGIALHLEQPEHYFDEYVKYGNSILRPIHYPALTGKEDPDAVRSGAHEDINLITLLIGASSPGLQVKLKNGDWYAVTTAPQEIVVNIGDMLQRLTNYRLKSTTHRVVNPPQTGTGNPTRFSVPFFLHPVSEMKLSPFPSCVGPNNPQRDPNTTAGEYLHERLREIGLY